MAESGLNLDDLQIHISVESAKAASDIEKLAKSLRELGVSSQASSGFLNNIVAKIKELRSSSNKVIGSVKTLDDTLDDTAKTADRAGKSFNNAAKGGLSKFGNTLARIGKMMIIRMAIRALIKAIKEGLEMFVKWDREVYGGMAGAANAMDRLKESTTMLKAQFGAFAGQLLTLVQPVFSALISGLTYLVNMFQKLIAVLRGTNEYYQYVADSASSAAGSAKELKKVLFGFDELNILPSKNGGGGGVSGLTGNYTPKATSPSEVFSEWFNFATSLPTIGNGIGKQILKAFGIDFDDPEIRQAFDAGIKQIKDWWTQKAVPWIEQAVQNVGGFLTETVPNFFKQTIPQAVSDVGNWITTTAQNAWNGVVNIWGRLKEWVSNLFTNTWNGATEIWSNFTSWVSTIASNAWGKVVEIWGNFKNWLNEKIATPITSLWTKIKDNVFTPIAKAWEDVKRGAVDAWEGIKKPFIKARDWFSDTFGEAWKKVKGIFSGDSEVIQGIKDGLSNTFKGIVNKLIGGLNSVIARPFNAINNILRKIKDVEIFSWKPFEKIVASVSVPQIPLLASGGVVPNTGSLFYAGEAGTEVVANMGHSTGVMNVSQMQEAVASGNIEVVNAVYAMANMVVSAVNNKNLDVYMDTQKVGQSVSRYQFNQSRRGIVQGAY